MAEPSCLGLSGFSILEFVFQLEYLVGVYIQLTICLPNSDLQRIGLAWDIPGHKSVSVCIRFEVSTTVNTKIDVFGNVTMCRLIETCRHLRHGFCSED
jgi:hypothetical protein